MAQRRNSAGLAVKTLFRFRVAEKDGSQNFDCHRAVQSCIAGAIHLSHPARPQRRDNFVRTEFGPRREPHALRVIIVLWTRDTHLEPKRSHSAFDSSHQAITPGWFVIRRESEMNA